MDIFVTYFEENPQNFPFYIFTVIRASCSYSSKNGTWVLFHDFVVYNRFPTIMLIYLVQNKIENV
jgi:hypothetical protein